MFKFKKRSFIAIILTILALFITKNIWLIFKPFPIEITLSADNIHANIATVINCKNNNKFHKVRKAHKNIIIKPNTKTSFEVPDIIFPKKLRIDFSNLKTNKPITIKEINFKNGKIKIKDYKKLSLEDGELKINKDEIVIYPKEENCKLLYDKKLNLITVFDFEIELFIIILILSYLLSYKLADYIANFNTIKSKPKTEIAFLALFFTLLFLPMSNIDKNEISKKENRTLEKYRPLITLEGKLNYSFGKDFDAWFSDRFFLRDDLIKLYYEQFVINKNLRTKKVIKGKDNWLFHGVPDAINMYTNKNLFSEENLENVAELLSEYDNYCKKNNKKFYFYIAPSKSMIYNEFYSELIKPEPNNSLSLANQLTEYLRKNTNIKVIYPQKELIQNKDKGLLYWKTDTHWNEFGAYLGYQILMKEINKDLNLKSFETPKFIEVEAQSGDLNKNLPKGLRIKKFETYKKPYIPNNSYSCQKTQDITDIQNCKGNLNNKNLLMFRDSFTINLIPYLASPFKKSKYVWQPVVDFTLMQEADVVVLEIVEVSLPKLIGIKAEF